ncbi:MAG: xanthine dehydrogenase family protein molybdopterin-binding subunit [Burkholderiaceae bacterium]|nr:MAG: xanthine dehydrogenase family protein molybdopterin-binding subunit [Burkholderiaceae bacterium]
MSDPLHFNYLGKKRRTKEDKRFVQGAGKFVADIMLPGTLHVAPVKSPYPCARIVRINTEKALALPGVHYVLTGAELEQETSPLLQYLNTPNVRWYSLAVDRARYAGEWVAAVVAESRHVAEDAAELVEVEYEELPFVMDPEVAVTENSVPVHPLHGSNVMYRRTFVWGDVEGDFQKADHQLQFRTRWNRNSTIPIETFGAIAQWNPAIDILEVWASVQMPQFAEQVATALRMPQNNVRVHYDLDVGGSFGVKRGIKQTVMACYLAKKLRRPVRFIEDRLDNMAGGDAHGPDRSFDVKVAFNNDGLITSLKYRVLDDAGAYPGRAPLQLGKPIGAIVGPYHIGSVEYEAISVTTNKTGQVAVRGFGQSPTNVAIETAVERVAAYLGIDRIEARRRNLIRREQFPYKIPSGSTYDSGDYLAVLDQVLDLADYQNLLKRRDALRAQGLAAGIGISAGLEPGGANSTFEVLMNKASKGTTFVESVMIKVDRSGLVTVVINSISSGQGHETLAALAVGEELGRDPDTIRVVHSDSLNGLWTHSAIGSRMAIMMGGAAVGAAKKIKQDLLRIAAHNLGVAEGELVYDHGAVSVAGDPGRKMDWMELVTIAHRQYQNMPACMEPALQATYVLEVPTGGHMPTDDGKVQMYPCYSFEAHVVLVSIDKGTGKPTILKYAISHDCGTVINPDIVRGMVLGGISQGIGAAFLERFEYGDNGQLLSQTFMDYLMPSIHEMPNVDLAEYCTPSPLTSFGQKGVGEGGYMGGPAALASAVNDALEPYGKTLDELPMRVKDLWECFHSDSKS